MMHFELVWRLWRLAIAVAVTAAAAYGLRHGPGTRTLGARVYHPVLYLLRTKIPVWVKVKSSATVVKSSCSESTTVHSQLKAPVNHTVVDSEMDNSS